MAHEVETMMYTREVPWHGLGVRVEESPNSEDAIKVAGLDWTVESKPIYNDNHIQIPGFVANTRSTDGSVLGIVSDKYKIVQNAEAFKFTDSLIGGDVRYETAGSLKNGKSIFLLAHLPHTSILGDEVAPYLCFTSTHDGTGSIKVCMTPIRVVCNNTLNLALNKARRTWTCRHMGNLEDKLAEATHTLGLANKYMERLGVEADRLANTTVTNDQIQEILAEMFPINTEDSDRIKANTNKAKTEFMVAYYMPDIAKFQNTAWGLINAASDFVGHSVPQRNTSTYNERNFERIIYGHPILDAIVNKFAVKA